MSRTTWRSNVRHKRLAVIPALAALAVVAAPVASASAASPLTGETLAGAATTTSGSAGGRFLWACNGPGVAGVSASFNASGKATGPYAGSFVETQGSASAFVTVFHNQLSHFLLGVPFTITSADGTTTITGSIIHVQYTVNGPLPWGFGFLCNGLTAAGLSVNTTASYTATIHVAGEAPQAISGQAHVSGRLYPQPGAQTSLTASFTG